MDRSSAARSPAIIRWHFLLRAVALLNIALWSASAIAVARGLGQSHRIALSPAAVQLALSAAYVLGCAFRSLLPVYDIPRLVLVESRFSSVLIGRSVATVAELCFAAQWAFLLHSPELLGRNAISQQVALVLVPLVLIAEAFSWYAVLTTQQRAHAVENSLWGIAGALVVVALLSNGPHRLVAWYPSGIAWCLAGILFVGYVFAIDVPMYWSRWRSDRVGLRPALTVAQGWNEVRNHRRVSHRWEDWKQEVPWMSLYFSFGVWSSISLVFAAISLAA